MRAWTLAACLLVPTSALSAAELEVAIVLDTSALRPGSGPLGGSVDLHPAVRRTLEALDGALAATPGGTSFALLYCRRAADGSERTQLRDFGSGLRRLGGPLELGKEGGCSASVDRVLEAVERLHWSRQANKRILAIGHSGALLSAGRVTLEDLAHRAEHAGIVLHAAELIDAGGWSFEPAITALGADVRAFLDRPALPLGRVPALARHATALSGGSFEVIVVPGYHGFGWWPLDRRLDKEARRRRALAADVQHLRKKTGIGAAYGLVAEGRDGLDALAEGLRRPSEVSPEALPEALRGQALEPLLDAIWDFVDARRVTAAALSQLEGEVEGSAAVGQRLAAAMLGPRRLPPSRR